MKIVAAPNALKGSLTALQAAGAIEAGVKKASPDAEVLKVPVADGGDGLVDVLCEALNGKIVSIKAKDPLGRQIDAEYAIIEESKTAIIEMALASGIVLLKDEERNPLKTSTFGTGELIKDAIERGMNHIIVGIGGSATNDCGIGMAAALGTVFLDSSENSVNPVGGNLGKIERIDMKGFNPRVKNITVEVVCDVDNLLLGDDGASRVYGPQKGASSEDVEFLESGMASFAEVMKESLGVDVRDFPGGGAAGGLGAGLHAFLKGELRSGVDVILDLVKLRDALEGADLVITAEGALDSQTAFGKAPAGVSRMAKEMNIPCVALAGGLGSGIDSLHSVGITSVFSICQGPVSLQAAMENAALFMQNSSEQVMRLFTSTSVYK